MDEPISTTYALKQDTSRHFFKEGDGPPRKCATLCEKQSEHIMLEIGYSTKAQPLDQSEGQPHGQPEGQPEEQPFDQPEGQPEEQPQGQEKDKAYTQGIPS